MATDDDTVALGRAAVLDELRRVLALIESGMQGRAFMISWELVDEVWRMRVVCAGNGGVDDLVVDLEAALELVRNTGSKPVAH